MKIAIFGLGYVGTVCGACLAGEGHEVVGVDVNATKVELVNAGRSPIVEPGLDELLRDAVAAKRLRATSQTAEAVAWADLSLVCVGTPSRANGSLNLDYVMGVCGEIGDALRARDSHHTVVIRSTVLPGTVDECAAVIANHSGKKAGEGFSVASNPEFLREGSAIKDFRNPPYTLVGADDPRATEALRAMYAGVPADFIAVPVRTAEMIKYVNNSYHALKVAFANEIGSVCKALGVDGHDVMEIFCRDTKLNISPAYFRPGFAYGGSCLPKDLSALNHKARTLDVAVPVLAHVSESNRAHIRSGLRMIYDSGHRRVGLLGLSFKAGTDDLRESPLVEVVETLIGKGFEVCIYDRNVNPSKLLGANRTFIEKQIPHFTQLFVDSVDEVLARAGCIVIGNGDPEFATVPGRAGEDQVVLDFVRITRSLASGGNYRGICW